MHRISKAALPIVLLIAAASYGQSLADVARQNRANKEKSAETANASDTTKKVYTTDDLSPDSYVDSGPEKTPEQWSRQILMQKGWVAYWKKEADRLTAAAPAGFDDPQVEKARQQLAAEQDKLAQMQEAAQQAGMPSSVYDPARPVRFMRSRRAPNMLGQH